MFAFLTKLLLSARARLKSWASLEAETLILRQQVMILSRKSPSRVLLRNIDRLIFVWLYRFFPLDSECDHHGQAQNRDPLATGVDSVPIGAGNPADVVGASRSAARSEI